MKRFSIDNFKKGIITSVLGIILIITGVILFFLPLASVLECITVIILGLSLLGIKDPRISGSGTIKTIVTIVGLTMLMMWLSGCVTWDKCQDKYGTNETHTIVVKDTVEKEVSLIVPAETIYVEMNIDSLLAAVPMKNNIADTFAIKTGRAQVKYWKDKYNNVLKSKVECLPDTIIQKKSIPVEVESECPDTVVLDPDQGLSWYNKLWRGFQGFSAWAVIVLFSYLVFSRLLKAI
ncbi:hypothetical protein JMN32_19850 [Fulvivirga sp. 29W222]|uniref:Uncharacterized protein n=1 Tax=Fulvivirga marina TaxID=2494733 RepID=A0A937G235_9BACT|nr:hypothetical protein [Fulvivirga marina]MBL6448575.1 hypothetical protein [Fulvivirga marina]